MKRKVPAAVAKGVLAKVPFQISFWLCTNQNLRSLADLSAALQRADHEVFRYHVNRDKNDFEVWIREVIKDKDLAREIARVKTKETLVRKISERVEELTGIVKSSWAKKKRKPKRSKKHLARTRRHVVRVKHGRAAKKQTRRAENSRAGRRGRRG